MNILEQKCNILKNTPQSRWFDLRYKAIFMQIRNMSVNAQSINAVFPLAGVLNFQGFFFQYDNEYYFLLICKIGNTIECFHLERTNSNYQDILSSHIVLSSDDDPKEQTFLPLLCVASSITSTKDLMSKCKNSLT